MGSGVQVEVGLAGPDPERRPWVVGKEGRE